MKELFDQFGIAVPHILLQLLIFVHVGLWIVATIRIARSIRGLAALGWILFALVVPILGPLAAMIAANRAALHVKV
jgi:hypothetical protein